MELNYEKAALRYQQASSSHAHATTDWRQQHRRDMRPHIITRDVSNLEIKKPVTKILRSGSFREKLENVFKSVARGELPPSVQRLQKNVGHAAEIEKAIKLQGQPLQQQPTIVPYNHVIQVNDLVGVKYRDKYSIAETQARCKLASLYRVIERNGWTLEIYNHISLRAPGAEDYFLINSFGLRYSEVTASNLVKVDLHGNVIDPGSTHFGISKAGYVIHSAIHEARKDIKCIIHLHTPQGAGTSAMLCGLLPLCQEALIVGGVSYHAYRGIVCDVAEKVELVRNLGPVNKVMILQNHGLLAMGSTVEEAYFLCYNLVVACETQVKALSAGLANVMLVNNEIASKVYATVSRGGGGGVGRHRRLKPGELEYEALMRELDNMGYNTGYPYKLTDLVYPTSDQDWTDEPTSSPSTDNDSSPPSNDGRQDQLLTSPSGPCEVSVVGKRIRQEINRIKRERSKGRINMLKQLEKEQELHDIKEPISEDGSIDLEQIALQSTGTCRPVYNVGLSTGMGLGTGSGLNTGLGTGLNPGNTGMSFPGHHPATQQSLHNPPTGIRFSGVDHHISDEKRQPISNDATPTTNDDEGGMWDFLDERQSHGPLPLVTQSTHNKHKHKQTKQRDTLPPSHSNDRDGRSRLDQLREYGVPVHPVLPNQTQTHLIADGHPYSVGSDHVTSGHVTSGHVTTSDGGAVPLHHSAGIPVRGNEGSTVHGSHSWEGEEDYSVEHIKGDRESLEDNRTGIKGPNIIGHLHLHTAEDGIHLSNVPAGLDPHVPYPAGSGGAQLRPHMNFGDHHTVYSHSNHVELHPHGNEVLRPHSNNEVSSSELRPHGDKESNPAGSEELRLHNYSELRPHSNDELHPHGNKELHPQNPLTHIGEAHDIPVVTPDRSLTDLRQVNTSSNTRQPSQYTALNYDGRNILMKVEATAKAVASSTDKSVKKLSNLKQHHPHRSGGDTGHLLGNYHDQDYRTNANTAHHQLVHSVPVPTDDYQLVQDSSTPVPPPSGEIIPSDEYIADHQLIQSSVSFPATSTNTTTDHYQLVHSVSVVPNTESELVQDSSVPAPSHTPPLSDGILSSSDELSTHHDQLVQSSVPVPISSTTVSDQLVQFSATSVPVVPSSTPPPISTTEAVVDTITTDSHAGSMYLYSPPLLDSKLTGLNKALSTAKSVAKSTELSVEKLNKTNE